MEAEGRAGRRVTVGRLFLFIDHFFCFVELFKLTLLARLEVQVVLWRRDLDLGRDCGPEEVAQSVLWLRKVDILWRENLSGPAFVRGGGFVSVLVRDA